MSETGGFSSVGASEWLSNMLGDSSDGESTGLHDEALKGEDNKQEQVTPPVEPRIVSMPEALTTIRNSALSGHPGTQLAIIRPPVVESGPPPQERSGRRILGVVAVAGIVVGIWYGLPILKDIKNAGANPDTITAIGPSESGLPFPDSNPSDLSTSGASDMPTDEASEGISASPNTSDTPSAGDTPTQKPDRSHSPSSHPTKKPASAEVKPVFLETSVVVAAANVNGRKPGELIGLAKSEGATIIGLQGSELDNKTTFSSIEAKLGDNYRVLPSKRHEADDSLDAALAFSKDVYSVVLTGTIDVPAPNSVKLSNRNESWPYALLRTKIDDPKMKGQLILAVSAQASGKESTRTIKKSDGELDTNGKVKRERQFEIATAKIQDIIAKIKKESGEDVEVVFTANVATNQSSVKYPTYMSASKPNSPDCIIEHSGVGGVAITSTKAYEADTSTCKQAAQVAATTRTYISSPNIDSLNAYFSYGSDRNNNTLISRVTFSVEQPKKKKN